MPAPPTEQPAQTPPTVVLTVAAGAIRACVGTSAPEAFLTPQSAAAGVAVASNRLAAAVAALPPLAL
ncbi:MAG: hypothetical protein OSA97_18855, partial [Nevskia sp.]|nr:hypothetical protein [Nevskia sp.]